MLETTRLFIRDIAEEDVEAFAKYNNHPSFSNFLPEEIIARRKKADYYINEFITAGRMTPRMCWNLAVTDKKTKAIIGDIVLVTDKLKHPRTCKVGFGLDPDYWGKGLMTEALSAVIGFVQNNLKIDRIETGADIANEGSWRVLEKCGFKRLYEKNGIYEYALIK